LTVSPFIPWPDGLILVLASRSPRRAALLQVAGIPFEVHPAQTTEAALAAGLAPGSGVAASGDITDPARYGRALAEAKAIEVGRRMTDRLVLGADTVVVIDGAVLEKPLDPEDAVSLLRRLVGRRHSVISAIALIGPQLARPWVGHQQTEVEFLPLDEATIRRYVATGEPMDKAGAYGIQGYGALMVRSIEGCYFNVMGLPLALLGQALREAFTGPAQE
jgi:septum formation protein